MRLLERALLTIALAAAFPVHADTDISGVTVNQRWPWSEKVDVDFILTGDASDVEITARWDGRTEPYPLASIPSCLPGANRYTWDPSSSEFAGRVLTGFCISVVPAPPDPQRYLVVDLVNGGIDYLAGVPEGGWAADHKSTKMVFRRIPKGTYALGISREELGYIGTGGDPSSYSDRWGKRNVTFTNDFYVAIFKYTEAQHACLTAGGGSSSCIPQKTTYYELRGAPGDVNWPNTGYGVAADSIVGKLRAKAGGLVVDLCEEEQWEVAARAGSTGFFPNGGTMADSHAVLSNLVSEAGAWFPDAGASIPAVGGYAPNAWGLYDVVGSGEEWVLDSVSSTVANGSLPAGNLSDSTNPTGVQNSNGWSAYRIIKGSSGNWASARLYNMVLAARWTRHPHYDSYATRFCIHLSPLGDLTFPSAR
ncbi:MAG: SUMF1/EgtB/PvdO family nonheme iron enzyme [Kiritimatiellae bacterium]|nr:SUMF1/EgtB/PvdO family nonheme iron enzyme [Kiritimatiellia bacterium]